MSMILVSDGFKEQYRIDNTGKDIKQYQLDADKWDTIFTYRNIQKSQHIITPANYSYDTDLAFGSSPVLRGHLRESN